MGGNLKQHFLPPGNARGRPNQVWECQVFGGTKFLVRLLSWIGNLATDEAAWHVEYLAPRVGEDETPYSGTLTSSHFHRGPLNEMEVIVWGMT